MIDEILKLYDMEYNHINGITFNDIAHLTINDINRINKNIDKIDKNATLKDYFLPMHDMNHIYKIPMWLSDRLCNFLMPSVREIYEKKKKGIIPKNFYGLATDPIRYHFYIISFDKLDCINEDYQDYIIGEFGFVPMSSFNKWLIDK